MLYSGPLYFFANHLTIIGEKHICEKKSWLPSPYQKQYPADYRDYKLILLFRKSFYQNEEPLMQLALKAPRELLYFIIFLASFINDFLTPTATSGISSFIFSIFGYLL